VTDIEILGKKENTLPNGLKITFTIGRIK